MKRLLLALSAVSFLGAALVLFRADRRLPQARLELAGWGSAVLAAAVAARAATGVNSRSVPAEARREPPVRAIAVEEIPANPGHFFCGWGVEWTWREVQEAADLTRSGNAASPDQILLSVLARRRARPIFLPLDRLAEHMRIHGATGSGKSRLLELLAVQAIRTPGLATVIFDPKGDQGLLNTVHAHTVLNAKPFHFFSPEWAELSIRYNPLANFSEPRDVPDRIKPLLPSIGEGEPYAQMQWKAALAICHALVACGYTPSFWRLRHHSETGGRNALYLELLKKLYGRIPWPADARAAALDYLTFSGRHAQKNGEPPPLGFAPHEAADQLTEIVMNADYYQKMTMSFLPLVTKLSDGALRDLLSHEGDLPQVSWPAVERSHAVAYLYISSMTGIETGSGLLKVAFLDLLNWLGRKYSYHFETIRQTPIFLFADEFGDLVMPEFISALNKGRSAGLSICAAAQTMADVVAKLSPSRARQIETNTRTVVQFRAADEDAETFSERAGEAPVTITNEDRTYEPSLFSSGHLLVDDLRASIRQKRDVKPLPAIGRELLLALPRFHFFLMEGARTFLGFIPVLKKPPTSFLGDAARRLRQGTTLDLARAPTFPRFLGARQR